VSVIGHQNSPSPHHILQSHLIYFVRFLILFASVPQKYIPYIRAVTVQTRVNSNAKRKREDEEEEEQQQIKIIERRRREMRDNAKSHKLSAPL